MDKSQATRSETDSRRATYQDVLDAPPDKVAVMCEAHNGKYVADLVMLRILRKQRNFSQLVKISAT